MNVAQLIEEWQMSFRIGQKVVCIKEGLWSWERKYPNYIRHFGIVHPKKGDVLTIRAIERGVGKRDDGSAIEANLLFDEIVNRPSPRASGSSKEAAFDSARFRPIQERKTDISIFTEMLKTDRAPALSTSD
jgi:hypothetical protein